MGAIRVGNLLHLGLLVKNVEDTVARGKRSLQRGAKVGEGHEGAEGAKGRNCREHGALGRNGARGSEHKRLDHLEAGEHHDGARRCRLALTGHAAQALLRGKELGALAIKLGQAPLARTELQDFAQAA